MEFMTGVNKKDTVEISEILAGDFEGKTVKSERCSSYHKGYGRGCICRFTKKGRTSSMCI